MRIACSCNRPRERCCSVVAAALLADELYYLGGWWAFSVHRLTQQVHASILDAFVTRERRPRQLRSARLIFHVLPRPVFDYGIETTTVEGTFAVAYLVFNTIMNLTTQDAQVACFRNVAAHLEPGGCFVIEVMLPDLQRLPAGETFRPFTVTPTRLGFDEYDVVAQSLISHHYSVTDGALRVNAIPFRYVWPAELDLMARLAGMTLRERWSDWQHEPFTADSTKHVSVWEKPGS